MSLPQEPTVDPAAPVDEPVEEIEAQEPDPGTVVPAFSEDDLRAHFEPDPDPTDPGPQDPPQEDPDDAQEPAPEPVVEEPVPSAGTPDPEPQPDPEPAQERSPAPDPTADPLTQTIDIGGTTYLLSDVQAQLEWARSLTPEQAARVAAALADQPDPSPAPTQEPEPQAPQFDPDEFVDPQLAQFVQQQLAERDAELARLRAAEEQRTQAELSSQQERFEQSFTATRSQIAEQYGLSEIEVSALTSTMEQSGIVAFLAQRDGIDDPESLFRTAYEQTYWTTPEFRDRAIAQTAQQTAEEAAAAAAAATQAAQDRKTRASALTGGGGTPAPRRAAPAPSTPEDRFAALAEGIRQGMSTN
jgi:hypothetical protein